MSVSHAHQLQREPVEAGLAGLQVITALRQMFDGVADPRKPRGVRHQLASVLTITVLAALCGAGNFREAGDRAAELPPDILAAAGARIDPATRARLAPSEATIRRIVCDIDPAHADALVGARGLRRVWPPTATRRATLARLKGWTGSTGWR